MKANPNPRTTLRKQSGYATMSVVAAISLAVMSMLTYLLIGNIRSFGAQSRAQVKQDYTQKEDAILSSLLHIVPNKAIGAMKQGSASTPENYTWETIFEEALALANAEQSADPQLLASLSLSDAISSNTGDTTFGDVYEFASAPVRTEAGDTNIVNGGNWWEYHMLGDASVGYDIPAPLELTYSEYLLDKKYPLISLTKKHSTYYQKGLSLSPALYPLYNLIEYPDLKFGYKRPGELFVAKRNWWIFSLTFGKHNESITGIPAVKKNYVLSIYEIPSQLPLSSAALMKVGQFADGTAWSNISLDGGINAEEIETNGTVTLESGSISARKSVSLNGTTTVDSRTVSNDFDDLGSREERALQSTSDFYDASTGGNVGKVAFIPINPGPSFLERSSDGLASTRISPTGWERYSRGANQAKMRIEVREMASSSSQLPVKIRFYYKTETGATSYIVYERGVNWPTDLETGGTSIPFQTDVLDSLRNALVLHLDRLPAFLESIAGAGHIDVNNSIHIAPAGTDSTVQHPSYPTLDSDMATTLRGGSDLTDYTSGFSIVTNTRLYIGDSTNEVAATIPANSGIASGETYYPPLSLFAPEKRFGESTSIIKPVELEGQISSLKTDEGDTFNPLELKTANDERIASNKLSAALTSLRSPADLPPINLMNWMVTIEEIH